MAGYKGWSMSNNAVEAYDDGEMPYSKWTKQELLDNLSDEQAEYCKKLTCQELKCYLLKNAGWHHSSKFYNCVDFYKIDDDGVEELTSEKVAKIISERPPRERKEKSQLVVAEPTYITAYAIYDEWEGTRKHPKKVNKRDIIQYRSEDKLVKCSHSINYNKRLSSINILYSIEQPSCFATEKQLEDLMDNPKLGKHIRLNFNENEDVLE